MVGSGVLPCPSKSPGLRLLREAALVAPSRDNGKLRGTQGHGEVAQLARPAGGADGRGPQTLVAGTRPDVTFPGAWRRTPLALRAGSDPPCRELPYRGAAVPSGAGVWSPQASGDGTGPRTRRAAHLQEADATRAASEDPGPPRIRGQGADTSPRARIGPACAAPS